jgi:pimeloyl-ACP methyl ester carboxylesterase
VKERFDRAGAATVRSLAAYADRPSGGTRRVVVVPGLGALGYLTRLLPELAARGADAFLLDLPGFGRPGGLTCQPTISAIAETTQGWLRSTGRGGSTVLVGHSTGAQAAARVAVSVPDALAGLVLSAPTFAPGQRRMTRLAATAPAAFRRESPLELRVVRDYLRAGRHVVELLRSGMSDRIEDSVRALTVPVVLTAGVADALSPRHWLDELADTATPESQPRVVQLAGSHNFPFTHPRELAELILSTGT